MRGLPFAVLPLMLVAAFAVFSLYGNLGSILASSFQDETGWVRGSAQCVLLMGTLFYPFYLAFCLSRHDDWQAMILRAAWWSLPLPLFVGVLQIANIAGVPGLSHLPYIGVYERGFFRVTSVSRESSWFGSFACVVLPFLGADVAAGLRGWRKWAGAATLGLLLIVFFLGFSKSAYAALVLEIGLGTVIFLAIRQPWRGVGQFVLGVLIFTALMVLLAVLLPGLFARLTTPLVRTATGVYLLFEPLLTGNTNFLSIGTRFGMSAAGTCDGQRASRAGCGTGTVRLPCAELSAALGPKRGNPQLDFQRHQ